MAALFSDRKGSSIPRLAGSICIPDEISPAALEQHLRGRLPGGRDSRCPWEFDKRLLEKALNAISRTFAHYSDHGPGHSRTILLRIEQILGQGRIGLTS